jgi:hypothetical protein
MVRGGGVIGIAIDDKALTSAIARFGSDAVTKIIVPSLERRANEARREAVQTFASQGVGRGIFGGRESGAYKIITLAPIELANGGIVARLRASGFARLQETGGRTKRHFIRRRKRYKGLKALAFSGGGEQRFAAWVNHPGGQVKKYPALEPAAKKAQGLVLEDIRVKLAALWSGGKAA